MRALKADEIEVRVGQVGKKGVSLLLYKNARVDSKILDETFGQNNWQCDFKEIKGNLFCGVGVWDDDKKQWVWKWDCGTESNTEKEKGEASDAYKRASFKWQLGVELYSSPFIFIPVATTEDPYNKGRYKLNNPTELRGLYVSSIKTVKGKIQALDIAQAGMIIWSTDKRKEGLTI